ncbi:MAG: hypothetical protein HPY68_08375 [Candidatus Atribacteria bacterium]|nr:hypothetical protein [Candidatus Atribacteria bacterium]
MRQGAAGQYLPLEGETLGSLVRFAKIPFDSFTLEPGKSQEIPVIITIPPSTPPGSYTLALVLTMTHVGGEKLSFQTHLVGVIFVVVRRPGVSHGRSGKYGEIERFDVKEEKGGIRFVAFLANRGQYYIEGKGKVLIVEKKAGRRVAEVPFQVGRGRVIPENAIGFPALLTEPLPKGEYVAIAQIDYGGVKPAEARLSFSCEGLKLLSGGSFVRETSEENVPVVLGLQESVVQTKIVSGAKRTVSIPVRNDFPLPVLVRAKARDAAPLDSARCAEFASVNPEVLEIPPYKTKVVKVTMAFPGNLPAGDKYLELTLTPEKAGEKTLSPELKEASAASVFLVFDNIRGEKVKQATLKNVEIQLAQDEAGNLFPRFLVSYMNTGNTHLTPSCRIEVNEVPKEQKGVVLERVGALISLRSEPSEDLVLPGMEGNITLSSQTPLYPGEYRLKVSLFEGEKELLTQETTFVVGKK